MIPASFIPMILKKLFPQIDKRIEELQAYRQSIESPTAEDASVCGTVESNS